MSVDTSEAWEERVKSEVLTRQDGDGDLWVLASDYAALLAERDAAYAAGQRDMQERAANDVLAWGKLITPVGEYVTSDIAADIRALPIKDKPDE